MDGGWRDQCACRPLAWTLAAWLLILLLLLRRCMRRTKRAAASATPPPRRTPDYKNGIAGEFTPAQGFDLVKTKRASLNISFYGLFRYMNQMPGEQTFTDHLGRERAVKARNDLNWHRTFVWLTGFFWDPKFRYNISLWSLPTTQQTLLFGNLQYRFSKAITLGVGIAPNLTARSVQGSWPFWGSSDRQMAEDFFRGGFSSGVFLTGAADRSRSTTRPRSTRTSASSASRRRTTRATSPTARASSWMPTTGEFGPRGGLGDFEYHREAGDAVRRSRPDTAAKPATR